jgi:hypothetical protein
LITRGADLFTITDNIGKSPYDMADIAPKYQAEIKDFVRALEKERATVKKVEEIVFSEGRTEAVVINVKGGSHHTLVVADNDNTMKVIQMVAKKLAVVDMVPDLELIEEIMGKGTLLI